MNSMTMRSVFWLVVIGSLIGSAQPSFGNSFSFTAIQYPGADSTSVADINDLGQIVGTYAAAGTNHLFLYNAGNYSTIDLPVTPFRASGINDSSQIVGVYNDGNLYHGFLYNAGSFTTIDLPGATSTLIGVASTIRA